MTRRHLVSALVGAVCAAVCASAGCSNGNQGAVSVRWRIIDRSSGVSYDPRYAGSDTTNGACFLCGTAGQRVCPDPAEQVWWVDKVELQVVDTATNQPIAIAPFNCTDRERTTAFTIPDGRYQLSLRAYRLTEGARDGGAIDCDPKDCACEWATPPPVIRDIKSAEITNLDVIEVGVEPPPPAMTSDGTTPSCRR